MSLVSSGKIRKRTSRMTFFDRVVFMRVIRRLIDAPGDPNWYGRMVGHHSNMSHNMHGMNSVGEQRFLPWHRVYLLNLERRGKKIDKRFFIPYWDWTRDRSIPSWITNYRPTVKVTGTDIVVRRNPGSSSNLPTSSQINTILGRTTFTSFTRDLERGPHNFVHGWVNGTMSFINIAPADPLFWMHHAQIDRLWSIWQANHPNQNPTLNGSDRIMDPWSTMESQVRSISALGYSYGP